MKPYNQLGIAIIVFLLINAFVWKEVVHLVGNFHTTNLRCETKAGEAHFHDEDQVEDACLICHLLSSNLAEGTKQGDCFVLKLVFEPSAKNLACSAISSSFSPTSLRGPPTV